MAEPTLKQILDALKNQVLVGKTYLNLANGLIHELEEDPVFFETAPTFFRLTVDGSLELAQMTIARLYDKKKRAVTVPKMLEQAYLNMGSFQRGDPQEVSEAIKKAQQVVVELKPMLDAIRDRRNQWLAHLDPETVANPQALVAKAKLTMPDLERAFKDTEEILVGLSRLYDGVIGDLYFIGGDDYKAALNCIRKATPPSP